MESLVMKERLMNNYKGKRVFVTGHTGFKGSWLLALLHHLGASVKGYALQPEYENSIFHSLQPALSFENIIADIRDKEKLSAEILSFQPDYIFHLAAQPLVRRSYKIPAETFEVNVVGTANVLEAVNQLKKPCKIIVVTTDKVYENRETGHLYNEDDQLGGYDPYSASKACTEMVVSSFRNSFFNTKNFQLHQKVLASARAGNVIGGGDFSEDRIVPDIMKALSAGKTVDVRNPSAVRPWQHVLEPLCGYLLLGACMQDEPEQFATAFNFGPLPDDHLTVKELVEIAVQSWGGGQWRDVSTAAQPHEAGLLNLNIQNAITNLNWHPKLNAKQAIEWTVEWYKQPADKKNDFTFYQIEKYLAL